MSLMETENIQAFWGQTYTSSHSELMYKQTLDYQDFNWIIYFKYLDLNPILSDKINY